MKWWSHASLSLPVIVWWNPVLHSCSPSQYFCRPRLYTNLSLLGLIVPCVALPCKWTNHDNSSQHFWSCLGLPQKNRGKTSSVFTVIFSHCQIIICTSLLQVMRWYQEEHYWPESVRLRLLNESTEQNSPNSLTMASIKWNLRCQHHTHKLFTLITARLNRRCSALNSHQ